MKFLVLGVQGKRSLGYAISQRLIANGHYVTPLAGSREETESVTERQVDAQDVVIDTQLPNADDARKTGLHLRPLWLLKLLKGSRKSLVVTSSVVVLGDTGPIPVGEDAAKRTPRKFAWLSKLESEILETSGVRTVVIRPAIEHYRSLSVAMGNCIALALRFKEGKYVGTGTNCWSAVHPDDLADLFCLAAEKAPSGTLFHAASETFSMKDLAWTIHRGLGLKGEPSALTLEEATRFSPIAENLTRSSAISGALAMRSLGWKPSRVSILKQVEHQARISRHELGRVPDPCFKLS